MRQNLILAAIGSALLILAVRPARAEITITITQDGPNVDATGSGSIDLTGLTFAFTSHPLQGVLPSVAFIQVGPSNTAFMDVYVGATGPSSFGPAGFTPASTVSGDVMNVEGTTGNIAVPTGYVSGTSLSGESVFDNATISSLGLLPGTYTYTWDGGGPDHTLVVQVGSVVPEPSTLGVGALGAVAFIAYVRSRHRRDQRRQAAA
jgi:hypothetical protein